MADTLCVHRRPLDGYCGRCDEEKKAKALAKAKPKDDSGALSKAEARRFTDHLKSNAATLWKGLVDAHDRGAHTALGFTSWVDYCETEFGLSRNAGYRLLTAGRVAEVIAQSPIGELGAGEPLELNEAQARELAPLVDEPEKLTAALKQASTDGKPTSKKIRKTVSQFVPSKPKKPKVPIPGQMSFDELAVSLSRHEHALLWVDAAETAGMSLDEWTAAALDAAMEFARTEPTEAV